MNNKFNINNIPGLNNTEKTKGKAAAYGCLYIIFLIPWLFFGLLFNLMPLLGYNFDKIAGTFVFNSAIISWALLPITFLFVYIPAARILFTINICSWIFFTVWAITGGKPLG